MVKEPTCQAGDLGSSPVCLEKERATDPSVLAREIPWTVYSSWGCERAGHDLTAKQQQQNNLPN